MIGPDLPANLLPQVSSSKQDEASDSEGPQPAPSIGPQIPSSIGPQISPTLPAAPRASTPPPPNIPEEEEDDDDYAPALPPELAAARAKKVHGPSFPPSVVGPTYTPYDDDDDDDVGPRPLPQGLVLEEKDGVQEFLEREERRRKNLEEENKPKAPKREEWMLVPPSSSDLLGSIDPTKLTRPRQFARTAQPSRNTDNSLWTETPAERQQRIADEVAGKRRRAVEVDVTEDVSVDARKRRRYEEEVRKGVEEHTRKVRGASLIEQHDRVTSVKEAEKVRNGDKDEPPAFWDRDRDMALGGRLMDDKTRNKFISEARGLGDRFGSGKSGGFL
ncbi:hypothetical protein BD309DRAFT_949030 [Dichomitus squalens]|uniref:Uncharacterized protein n=1 Tax=Dichomitus squalens TaxID=114155 RepID=A0A4Q9MG42_9APHY|nr:hypothetical protein BD311DRAFT_762704 [Dichomitus squalens]TBU48719.1 hypothetical protein BD309DRAFT_949030 [Dichomitus squalens]